MSSRLLLAAPTVAILAAADTAGAIIATNTIDRDVIYSHAGARATHRARSAAPLDPPLQRRIQQSPARRSDAAGDQEVT